MPAPTLAVSARVLPDRSQPDYRPFPAPSQRFSPPSPFSKPAQTSLAQVREPVQQNAPRNLARTSNLPVPCLAHLPANRVGQQLVVHPHVDHGIPLPRVLPGRLP